MREPSSGNQILWRHESKINFRKGIARDSKHVGVVMLWSRMAVPGTTSVFIGDVTADRRSRRNSEVSPQIQPNAAKPKRLTDSSPNKPK